MPRRRTPPRTRVLLIDGEVHVIAERGAHHVVTIRLRGVAAKRALSVLDDAHYGIAAAALGSRRRPP